MTNNPEIHYQGVPFFCCIDGFTAHLDEKTVNSLLRYIKAIAAQCELRADYLLLYLQKGAPTDDTAKYGCYDYMKKFWKSCSKSADVASNG